MPAVLKFEPAKCTECFTCELACSFERDRVFNRQRARLRVVRAWPDEARLVVCAHCDDPTCAACCPSEAMQVVGHRVVLDAEACTGCGICVEQCPHGAVFLVAGHHAAVKCEACDDPECVRVCPTRALTLVRGGDGQ
ncbi:MAG: 4Fe-4S binding protein [Bacillota bacterium]